MKRAAFTTLGCKVNQFETETMEGLFRQKGYEIVPFTAKADVYTINTCSVTLLGEKKSRQLVRRAARLNPAAVIVVTGCYAQLAPEKMAALPGVGLVIGNQGRQQIVELVEQAAAEKKQLTVVSNIMQADTFEDIPLYGTPERTRAFLKIQEGCQNFCTFCIIPYARGPLRSRPLASVAREAAKLVEGGFKEIVLTGIHLGAYGRDLQEEKLTLADAAREVLKLQGLRRLRLGSLESVELSSELFSLLRADERFARQLHLPLQAGSDEILKRMNRHYDTAEFTRLLQIVRQEVPDVAITTDIIVGFPGETEELFQKSLEYAGTLGFARMHVFPYSPRPGTPAATMPDQIPEQEKKSRVHRMQQLADKMAAEYQARFAGQEMDVLFETKTEGVSDGLTGNYLRIYTDAPVVHGEIYRVRLQHAYKDGLWGEPVAVNRRTR